MSNMQEYSGYEKQASNVMLFLIVFNNINTLRFRGFLNDQVNCRQLGSIGMLWFVVKGFLPLPKKKIVGRWSGGAHLHKSNGGVYLCSQNMSSEGGIYKDFWYEYYFIKATIFSSTVKHSEHIAHLSGYICSR